MQMKIYILEAQEREKIQMKILKQNIELLNKQIK
jgi:hypothetical protein